jgi:hypothetical protein
MNRPACPSVLSPDAAKGDAMMTDQHARQAFETLIENILCRVRAVPEQDREALLNETRLALREMAMKHGLVDPHAARWAGEIDQELRFRLLHDAQATANDNT